MNPEPPKAYSGPFLGLSLGRGLTYASLLLAAEATIWGALSFFLPEGWWHLVINISFFLLAAAGGVEIKNWLTAYGKPSWVGYVGGLLVFFLAVIVWRSILMGILEATF